MRQKHLRSGAHASKQAWWITWPQSISRGGSRDHTDTDTSEADEWDAALMHDAAELSAGRGTGVAGGIGGGFVRPHPVSVSSVEGGPSSSSGGGGGGGGGGMGGSSQRGLGDGRIPRVPSRVSTPLSEADDYVA